MTFVALFVLPPRMAGSTEAPPFSTGLVLFCVSWRVRPCLESNPLMEKTSAPSGVQRRNAFAPKCVPVLSRVSIREKLRIFCL